MTMRTRRNARLAGSTLRLLLVFGLMIPYLSTAKPAAAAGMTYYVSTSGSDGAAGTVSAPLRTVQAAVNKATAGDTVIIRGGTYDERPVLAGKGTSTARITVKSYSGETANIARGLWVRGDYYQIENILVTPGVTTVPTAEYEAPGLWSVYGQIKISGHYNEMSGVTYYDQTPRVAAAIPVLTFMGSYNTVRNVNFSNSGGLSFVGTGMRRPGLGIHNKVSGGTLHHTYDTLANISADYATIEGLDMHDPGQVNKGGNSTDGINLDGHHITIRNNRIHGIMRKLEIQHTDAIQWWNRADDLLIEGNILGSYRQLTTDAGRTYYDQGHIQWETYATNSVTGEPNMSSNRVIIRNNTFINAGEYYSIVSAPAQIRLGAADDWKIVNNTFRCPQPIRSDWAAQARRWTIANNIFNGSGGNYGTSAADWQIDYNAYGGTKSPQDGPNSMSGVNPQYVKDDVTAATNYGVDADWRLTSTSPVINKGSSAYAPATDALGNVRVGAPDMGALEYGGTTSVTTPPSGSMSINNGAAFTTTTTAVVNSNITGATQMRFDTGSGFDAWLQFSAISSVTLPTGDGVKTVSAQYQNAGGTYTLTDTITLDVTAPSGTFTINGGALQTGSTTVNVQNLVSGATKMRFDTGSGYGAWAAFASATTLTLPGGEGAKTVSAQYADDAGNTITRSVSISLVSLPTGTMNVNGGASFTNTTTVTVNSTVTGATEMRCDPGLGYAPWHLYESVHPLTLPIGDGVKTVAAEYRNAGGSTYRTTSIILDTVAPTGTVSINAGASQTKNVNVTVSSNVEGANQMRFDTGSGFGAWVQYSASYGLTLPSGNGVKTVRAEYRDQAGNVFSTADDIKLFAGKFKIDRGASYTISRAVDLNSDVAGAVAMRIDSGSGYGSWTSYGAKRVVLPFGQGSKTVRVQYMDPSGASLELADAIILDTVAPSGSMRVNRGSSYTRSRSVYINSSVKGATKMRIRTGKRYGAWTRFLSTKKAYLTAGSGTKRVYVEYMDRAGNRTRRTDTIVLR